MCEETKRREGGYSAVLMWCVDMDVCVSVWLGREDGAEGAQRF